MNTRYTVLHDALHGLETLGVTLSDLLHFVLVHKQYNDPTRALYRDLLDNTKAILAAFYRHDATAGATRSWTHDMLRSVYADEVRKLTRPEHGWNFSAMQASPEEVLDFRIEDMATQLETRAPELWSFVCTLLGGMDSSASREGEGMEVDAEDEALWAQVEGIAGLGDDSEGGSEKTAGGSGCSRTLVLRIVCSGSGAALHV